MKPRDARNIVRLARASNPAEAHLIEQVLEEEGIRSQVVGDYLDAGIGDIPGIQAEVWVERDDLARAREVLQNSAHHESLEEENEPDA
jgi:hypothetical protein